jgi:hypothetical protein
MPVTSQQQVPQTSQSLTNNRIPMVWNRNCLTLNYFYVSLPLTSPLSPFLFHYLDKVSLENPSQCEGCTLRNQLLPVLERHPVGFRIPSVTLALQFPVLANTSPEVPFGLQGIRTAYPNICNPADSVQLGTNSLLTRQETKYHDYRILSVGLNVILRLLTDAVSDIGVLSRRI